MLFTSALALSNDSNNTILNNPGYGIFDRIAKEVNLPIVGIISILLFIAGILISEYREKAKLEQFYTVCTDVKKLKPKDFDINIYSDYIKKGSHDPVLNLIKTGEKKILIKGVSGLGKTRTIYEVIKEFGARHNFLVNKLNNIRIPERFQRLIPKVPILVRAKNISRKYSRRWKDYYVIVPSKDIKLPIKVPRDYFIFKRRFLLFFDDLDKYVSRKIDINSIINEFEKNSEHLIVLATCREEEFQILETEKVQETFKIVEQDLWSYEEGEKLAKSIGKKFNRNEFDFTPSSIVLDSPRKKCYWNGFTESEKNILRAIKLLNRSNIFKPQIQLIKKVHEYIFTLNNDKFNTHFQDLKDKKFIFSEKDTIFCADYYLWKIVEDYPIGDQLFSDMLKLKEVLTEMKCWENLLNLGNAFYFKEDYQNAVDCHDKVLKINPKSEKALAYKGAALAKSGKNSDAVICYDKALEINPKYVDAWYNKGVSLDKHGKYDESIICYDRTLEINPRHVEALVNKGAILVDEYDKLYEGIIYFDKALEINPKKEEALVSKGAALGKSSKHDEAIIYFDKALEINPKSEEALVNKCVALVNFGKYSEAIICYDKILEINPKSEDAWYNKGGTLIRAGKHEEAINCFDKALEINPKNENAWNSKGIALAESGKHSEAINCFDKALEINPKNEKAFFNRGDMLSELGKFEDAIKSFDKALEIKPNDDTVLCHKGSALSGLGNHIEAIKCFDKVLEIDPKHNDAYYKKARALSLLDKYDEAIKYLDKYLEINPEDDDAWYNCACIHPIKGEKEKALSCLKKAIEISGSNKEKAKKDKDFEKFWDDEDFKKLVA